MNLDPTSEDEKRCKVEEEEEVKWLVKDEASLTGRGINSSAAPQPNISSAADALRPSGSRLDKTTGKTDKE